MHEDARTTTPRGRYKTAQAVVVALLVVGLLTAIFIFQNTTRARVRFLFWSASVPLAGALILAAVLGGIIAFLVAFVRQRRIARDSRAPLGEESSVNENLDGKDR
ncbi:MAG: DUF1049 domain-containing protein [Actinobacteria bacterium]|jgi:uncharacterized integral membrane protein|nr:DUF1049 domain-containing protein [Actinomycetota bacterium]